MKLIVQMYLMKNTEYLEKIYNYYYKRNIENVKNYSRDINNYFEKKGEKTFDVLNPIKPLSTKELWDASPWMQKDFRTLDDLISNHEQELLIAEKEKLFQNQSSSWHLLVHGLVQRSKEIIDRKLNKKIDKEIIFATLPHGSINAITFKLPENDKYAIFFDENLFAFLFKFSHLFSQLMPPEFHFQVNTFGAIGCTLEWTKKSLAKEESTLSKFLNIFLEYVCIGNSSYSKPELAEINKTKFAASLLSTWELFIVSHEIGHIIKGHLDNPAINELNTNENTFNTVSSNYEKEFEADLFASLITPSELLYTEIPLLFSVMELVFESISILKHGEIIETLSEKHPTPYSRAERLNLLKPMEAHLGIETWSSFELLINEIKIHLYPKLRSWRNRIRFHHLTEW